MTSSNKIGKIALLCLAMRPIQWFKNLVIIIPFLTKKEYRLDVDFLYLLLSVTSFCLVASAVYIINDLVDQDEDQMHPIKKYRPIPSQRISPKEAGLLCFLLILLAMLSGYYIGLFFFVIIIFYFAVGCIYSFFAKKIIVLDLILVTMCFGLRTIGGYIAFEMPLSYPVLISIAMVTCFLALGKRRAEKALFIKNAVMTRHVIKKYSLRRLDLAIVLLAIANILSYIFNILLSDHLFGFKLAMLFITTPLVILGFLRYCHIIFKQKKGENPVKIIVNDPPILLTFFLWAGCISLLLNM